MQEIDPLRRQGALLKKNSHLDVAARPGRGVRGLHESGRMTGGTGPALWSCPPLSSLSFLLLHRSAGPVRHVFRSALRGVGAERVIGIAGIHKIGAGGAQQSFDLLHGSPNYTARLARLNLALQLKEAPIGAVETLRQDRCTGSILSMVAASAT